MKINIEKHPCFNPKACNTFGRIHLPVAPRCNIQCNFCNRKFDCVNETRPGVTSAILEPRQALAYLSQMFARKKNLAVVGIAGPGDPFANPTQTLETLQLVRAQYPEMLLCVATNGLNVLPYLDDLADLKVSHVSITVNAVDAEIGAKIYGWMRPSLRAVASNRGGAQLLINSQFAAIAGLKKRNIIVKVNSIVLPGINMEHMEQIAKTMAGLGVDLFNCMPYYPNKGSKFEDLAEPSPKMMAKIREQAGKYVHQMLHCTRCRADAVGLLNEPNELETTALLTDCAKGNFPTCKPDRPYVAVASREGMLVNQHLGEAWRLFVYGKTETGIALIEEREAPEPGSGTERWNHLADILSDCNSLLVNGAGNSPRQCLAGRGMQVHIVEGLVQDAVRTALAGENMDHFAKRTASACGIGNCGAGAGCN